MADVPKNPSQAIRQFLPFVADLEGNISNGATMELSVPF
jgi:hypothetical protein